MVVNVLVCAIEYFGLCYNGLVDVYISMYSKRLTRYIFRVSRSGELAKVDLGGKMSKLFNSMANVAHNSLLIKDWGIRSTKLNDPVDPGPGY